MIRSALGLLLVLGLSTLAPASARAACHEDVAADDAHQQIEAGDVIVLDVRTPGEFASHTGHIDGAVLVPLDQLEAVLGRLESGKDRTFIVVCRSGNRSAVASQILCDGGFSDVFNLSGGMNAWIRAGLPVVHG